MTRVNFRWVRAMDDMTEPTLSYERMHEALHDLWTWAVGMPGYDKSAWIRLSQTIDELEFQRRSLRHFALQRGHIEPCDHGNPCMCGYTKAMGS